MTGRLTNKARQSPAPFLYVTRSPVKADAMTPDGLTSAARNLAHGLGIPVYIRDGRIYQHGTGIEFLPPKYDRLAHSSDDDLTQGEPSGLILPASHVLTLK